MNDLPNSIDWFTKLNLVKFIPWHIKENLGDLAEFNLQFKKECPNRDIITFANRQDMDSFAGFEIVDGKITEKIIVFHLTFTNNPNWNIIENEYDDFFEFLKWNVLPTMKEWIQDEDIADYINK